MKPLSPEGNFIGLGVTANQISGATVVRLVNTSENSGTVQVLENDAEYNGWGAVIGSITIPAGEVVYIQKKSEEWLSGDSYINYTQVAYSHMMSFASYGSSGGGGGGDNVVTDNMVVYLDAGNNSSYSGSGTSWNDISGNSNNFTLTNGPTYSSSDGGAIVFDGTNDFAISATNASFFAFGTNTDYSYGVWAKMDSTDNTESLLSCGTDQGGGTQNSFQLDFEGTNTRIRHLFRDGGSQGQKNFTLLGSSGLVGTGWVYVMVVNDRSENQLKVYVNGTSHSDSDTIYGTATDVHNFANNVDTTGEFKIGVNRGGVAFIDGRVAQVHIYKGKALTDSEVLQNYNASKSRYGL